MLKDLIIGMFHAHIKHHVYCLSRFISFTRLVLDVGHLFRVPCIIRIIL